MTKPAIRAYPRPQDGPGRPTSAPDRPGYNGGSRFLLTGGKNVPGAALGGPLAHAREHTHGRCRGKLRLKSRRRRLRTGTRRDTRGRRPRPRPAAGHAGGAARPFRRAGGASARTPTRRASGKPKPAGPKSPERTRWNGSCGRGRARPRGVRGTLRSRRVAGAGAGAVLPRPLRSDLQPAGRPSPLLPTRGGPAPV